MVVYWEPDALTRRVGSSFKLWNTFAYTHVLSFIYICSNVGDICVIKNAKRDFNFDVYTWDGIDLIFHRTWICI